MKPLQLIRNTQLSTTLVLTIILMLTACGSGQSGTKAVDTSDATITQNVNNISTQLVGCEEKPLTVVLTEHDEFKPAKFSVIEDTAYLKGNIDSTILSRVHTLLADFPTIKTIVLTNIPGTFDEAMNQCAARLIRQANITTIVPFYASIASGGVSFFMGGIERIVEAGAKVRVHSWREAKIPDATTASNTNYIEGKDIPEDDPRHNLFLDFYIEMGIPDSFYWFTLETPANQTHVMTSDELIEYGVATYINDHIANPLGTIVDPTSIKLLY